VLLKHPISIFLVFHYLFGLYVIMHYQWLSTNGKNQLILWKLNSIWMKILNDIAYAIWIDWNSIQILKLNWIQLKNIECNSNFIEFKLN
jgi:hypothetical protein